VLRILFWLIRLLAHSGETSLEQKRLQLYDKKFNLQKMNIREEDMGVKLTAAAYQADKSALKSLLGKCLYTHIFLCQSSAGINCYIEHHVCTYVKLLSCT